MKTLKNSFYGFDLMELLKGRKRMIATVIGGILGYWISDSVTVATISGGVVEILFALVRFYYKK